MRPPCCAAAFAGAGAAAAIEAASRGAAKPETTGETPLVLALAFCCCCAFCRVGYIPRAAWSLRPPAVVLRPPLLANEDPFTEDFDDDDEEEGLLLIPPLLRPLVVPQKPCAAWIVFEPLSLSSPSAEATSSVDSSAGGETGPARAKVD